MSIKSINGCIGCEECIKSCPTDVIRLNPDTKKAEIFDDMVSDAQFTNQSLSTSLKSLQVLGFNATVSAKVSVMSLARSPLDQALFAGP